MRQLADDLLRRERGGFELGDLRERVVERGVAVALAGVSGVEKLLLRGECRLHAPLVVVGGEPGVEGHGGQEQCGEKCDEFECATGHGGIHWVAVKNLDSVTEVVRRNR